MSGVDYHQLIETAYLGSWDLDGKGDAVVQIEAVHKWQPEVRRKKKQRLLQRDGTIREVEAEEPVKRVVIFFLGKRKPWLAGPVSQKAIAGMYGNKVNDWLGKRITLYVDPTVRFGSKVVGGIRVRPVVPTLGVTTRTLDQPVDAVKSRELEAAREETSGARSASTPGPELESGKREGAAALTSERTREPGEEG